MSDENDPRPADTDNKLLQKIAKRLASVSVTGGLTDTQLRATAVSVQGADAQDAAPTIKPIIAAAELQDPSALPANGVVGVIRRLLANLKGILLVQQADLSHSVDTVSVWPSDSSSVVSSTALGASLQLKSLPGKLMWVSGYNSKGTAQFIQLLNASSLPGNGAVPVVVITAAATSNFSIPLPDLTGMDFSAGICIANSSTAATLTVGSADCFFSGIVI